jgi:hypothetical protein
LAATGKQFECKDSFSWGGALHMENKAIFIAVLGISKYIVLSYSAKRIVVRLIDPEYMVAK